MPRKGENIYKRKDGRWEGRYIIERIPHQRARYGSVYGKSYREVKEKLLIARQNINLAQKDPPALNKATVTVEDIAGRWLAFKSSQIKEATYNKYRISLEQYIFPYVGSLYITQITKQDIEEYSRKLMSEGKRDGCGLSPKTVSDTLNILNNVFAYASEHDYSLKPGVTTVKIRQKQSELAVFNKEEQKTLSNYLMENMSLCNLGILVCLFTGLRIGELCALRWENINLKAQTIYVCQTLQRLYPASKKEEDASTNADSSSSKTYISISTPKSACSIRTIPIPECLVKIMSEYEQTTGYLLTGKENAFIEPRSYRNHFNKVLASCNIKGTHFHVVRHTFATRCVELGFDVKTLSEILGHANVNITMNRYVHPSMDTKRTNMELLNSLL